MRNWLRERLTMRRRKGKGPNESESTGKVGQELPKLAAGQPAPLQPTYDFDGPPRPREDEAPRRVEASRSVEQESSSQVDRQPQRPESRASEPAQAGERRSRRSRRGGRRRGGARRNQQPGSAPQQANAPRQAAVVADERDDGDFGNEFAEAAGKMEIETQPDATSVPPAAPATIDAATQTRQPRGVVVLTIGLPGSGKTTWFKRRGVTPLSSDLLRSVLFDDITEQRYQGLVFSTLRSLLRARLIAKMPWNYVDATNLSPHERRQWIKMARSFGYEVHAVFFNVPVEVCLARNERRERKVDGTVIQRMAERLRPPSFKEGFSKIVVVKVKDPQRAIEQAQNKLEEPIAPDAFESAEG